MGCDLPKIHIEWDEAHADGLKPELRTYKQIVTRLGSHDGVETSLDTGNPDERSWQGEAPDAPREHANETDRSGGDRCGSAGGDQCANAGGVLHDVRAMCRSLGRLRELGATVTIDGRDATTAALDAYEDTLAREICRLGVGGANDDSGARADGSESDGGFLNSILYVVGLAVVLQWFFSCS